MTDQKLLEASVRLMAAWARAHPYDMPAGFTPILANALLALGDD